MSDGLDFTFPNLIKEVVIPNRVLYIQNLSRDSIKEIQRVLKISDYYKGVIDGIYGIKTLNAISGFKKDSYLARPTEIGKSTVAALERLWDKAKVTEQSPKKPPTLNIHAGKHTGKSVIIPGGVKVHENELIVENVPLTWGEMTKGLTRIPHNEETVRNIRYTARKFAKIRKIINQPLKITSGYRPPHLKIGARFSQHKLGKAIDITTFNPRDIHKLWIACVKSDAIGLGRGMKRGFVHVDYREHIRRVIFDY